VRHVKIVAIVVIAVVQGRKGSVEIVESDLKEIVVQDRHGHRVIGPQERREIGHRDLRESSVVQRHRQERKILRHHQHHQQTILVLPRASKRRAKPCYWHHHVQNIAVSTEVV
jgi:hypothetical protein